MPNIEKLILWQMTKNRLEFHFEVKHIWQDDKYLVDVTPPTKMSF